MTKVALRGIRARKLRAFTTWLAIFLGVALVAGTYVLTDTINRSFEEIFTESLKGTDVAITAQTNVETNDATPPAFPATLLARVRKVNGVEAAAGSVFASGRFVDAKGDPIGNSFAPNFIASLNPPRFETLTLRFEPDIRRSLLHLAPAIPEWIGTLRLQRIPLMGGHLAIEATGDRVHVTDAPEGLTIVGAPRHPTR